MSTRINPVIKPVIETFRAIYGRTTVFAKSPHAAINGLLVMGDAGTGKTHWVRQALRDAGVQSKVEMMKGGTLTAASLYVKMFLNRASDRIMVFDDVDLLGHPEKNKIIPMILGACQEGKNRQVTWSTARKNALMEEYDVPFEFEFNGKIIFITNYTWDDIKAKAKQWTQAFSSRFNDAECIFTHEQKYMYTRHLVDVEDMLGANCQVHEYKDDKGVLQRGYPVDVVEQTINFIDDNYENFSEITPRVAVKIADTIHYNDDEEMMHIMLDSLVK
jgi:hypothetical protein